MLFAKKSILAESCGTINLMDVKIKLGIKN